MASSYDYTSPETLKAGLLARLAADGIETREGSFSNTLLSEWAFAAWDARNRETAMVYMACPDETSGEYLDRRAGDFGLVRTDGLKATVTVEFTGQDGSVIPAGTVVCDASGVLRYLTDEAVVISDGTASVTATAEGIGSDYNVEPDKITSLAVNLSGVESLTNPAAGTGGADLESDADFYARFHDYLSRPVSSGNVNHYRQWAREVPGVSYAAVLPLWAGNGSVKVVLAGADRGPVSDEIVAACAAHIEEERPIGAEVTVVSAVRRPIDLAAQVTVSGVNKDAVAEELTRKLAELLAGLEFGSGPMLRYNRLLGLLLSCDGVEDYTNFTVNGGTENLVLVQEDSPEVGTVEIT